MQTYSYAGAVVLSGAHAPFTRMKGVGRGPILQCLMSVLPPGSCPKSNQTSASQAARLCIQSVMLMEAPKIGTIIPYFQREAGILNRALLSIAGQTYSGPVTVIIVDDSSPAPQPEIGNIHFPDNIIVKLILTFLDSDDQWENHHLEIVACAHTNTFDIMIGDWTMRHTDKSAHDHYFAGRLNGRMLNNCPISLELETDLMELAIERPRGKTSTLSVSKVFLAETRL
jgi:hypothetical protein